MARKAVVDGTGMRVNIDTYGEGNLFSKQA